MTEPADQTSDTPAPPKIPSSSKSDNAAISAKPEPVATANDASYTEVLNAMRSAEEAVSSAVQGMADIDQTSSDNNHK